MNLRLALPMLLVLLAACSPRAAEQQVDPAAAAAVAPAPEPAAVTQPAAAPEDTVTAAADDTPDPFEELQRARAEAGCEIPEDVYDLDDIRLYCTLPADVRTFLARENTCQHFAGEEPYDDARRAELEQASAEYCDGREQRFADLFEQHRDDCSIRGALIDIGNRYDLFTLVAPDPCRAQD
ncbi:hypothetical protein [Stenotrophomonas sp. PD6]|uniref:hypothetical protein n=1 Tax=Stenotrophomonas sp. PD6 TaxID=3368612 RepID=UPI003BA10490